MKLYAYQLLWLEFGSLGDILEVLVVGMVIPEVSLVKIGFWRPLFLIFCYLKNFALRSNNESLFLIF
jgi:hypothetical protein